MNKCNQICLITYLAATVFLLHAPESAATICGAEIGVTGASGTQYGSSKGSFSIDQFGPPNSVKVSPFVLRTGFGAELDIRGSKGKYKFSYSGEISNIRLLFDNKLAYEGAPIAVYDGKGGKLRIELESKGNASVKVSDQCGGESIMFQEKGEQQPSGSEQPSASNLRGQSDHSFGKRGSGKRGRVNCFAE